MKKVVQIGPESTGKSSLSAQLASSYGVSWCPEYAREYLTTYGSKYQYADLLTIAQGQIEQEDRYIREAISRQDPLLFIDTDMYVMKVWCEFVFGRCHQFILEQIALRQYDYYLLCDIDLPWVKDELREYPDPEPRKQLMAIYKDILVNQNVPWTLISGDPHTRLKKATEAINILLKQ